MELTVFGIDGASKNIFGPWLNDLPNLRETIESGYSGNLTSTDPPLTNVAWTSFFTGKGPGQTGIYDWNYLTKSYNVEPYRGHKSREKALYDLIPGSININVPSIYPRIPTTENSEIIHSFDAPGKDVGFPEEYKSYTEYDDYVLEKSAVYGDMATEKKIERLRDTARARFEFAKRVFEEDEEFFFLMFSETDWGLHLIEELSNDVEDAYRGLYEDLDNYLGWFRERSDNVVIVSDHGFERKIRKFNLGEWLQQNGYLARVGETTDGTGRENDGHRSLLQHIVTKNDHIYSIAKRSYDFLEDPLGLQSKSEQYDEMLNKNIDYDRTEAFKDGGLWNLLINRAEYFDSGCVLAEDVESVKEELIEDLSEAVDPKTGNKALAYAKSSKDVYGRDIPKAPDVVLNPGKGVTLSFFSVRRRLFEDTSVYHHRMDGFFTLEGEAFESGSTDADIVDLMPTILHALDRPVPQDVDGDVLIIAFDDDRQVKVGDPAVMSDSPPTRTTLSKEDDEILQERLEDLGYM